MPGCWESSVNVWERKGSLWACWGEENILQKAEASRNVPWKMSRKWISEVNVLKETSMWPQLEERFVSQLLGTAWKPFLCWPILYQVPVRLHKPPTGSIQTWLWKGEYRESSLWDTPCFGIPSLPIHLTPETPTAVSSRLAAGCFLNTWVPVQFLGRGIGEKNAALGLFAEGLSLLLMAMGRSSTSHNRDKARKLKSGRLKNHKEITC